MIEIKDKIIRFLEDMGDTSESIAAFLEGQGIKGYAIVPNACPVANYLKRMLDLELDEELHVGGGTVDFVRATLLTSGHRYSTLLEVIDLPVAVDRFVMDFDSERYPNLMYPKEN